MTQPPNHKMILEAIAILKQTPLREIQRLGYQFQPNDFYTPLNDCDFLESNRDLWDEQRSLLAIDWNLEGQLAEARVVSTYVEELRDIPQNNPADQLGFCWQNMFWNNADALVQYGLLRSRRPRRVVEIGCGWSSLLMQRALERNASPCQVQQIEPYPNERIFAQLPKDWIHHHCILQRAPLKLFEALEANDICFYDGSHCVHTASDVNWFFFEILPRLKPGVLIHLHDIFFPEHYPDAWIFDRGQSWNEQYLLQAFLMHNQTFRIVIANRYLWRKASPILDDLYKGVQPSYGCSFWMEKTGG